jgi:hypothetical protein
MLPDFPDVKRIVLKALIGRSKLKAEADPLLGLMPPFIVHEGDRSVVRREDGTETVAHLREYPLKATTELTAEEMRVRGPAATEDAVARLAEGLNEGLARRTIAAIEAAAESVGNSVKAGGPFTAETYFAMLEKVELVFSANGDWAGLTLMAHPDTVAKAEPVLTSIETDPELKARRDAIVARKREEWRVREAARKLVD